jgi:hypothetical protein
MLTTIMQATVMLTIMLTAVMLSVVMLSAVAPNKGITEAYTVKNFWS